MNHLEFLCSTTDDALMRGFDPASLLAVQLALVVGEAADCFGNAHLAQWQDLEDEGL